MSLKSFENVTEMPKSLWGFYARYGVKNYKVLIFWWMFFVLIAFAGGIIWPNFNRWVVALFENPVPEGMSFIRYAMPTIILITVLNMMMTASDLIQDTISSHLWPRVRNQISDILATYTHKQSMTFWNNKMSGSINQQINYIIFGFTDVFSQLWRTVGRLMIILVNGVLLLSINKWVAYLFVFSKIGRAHV